MEDWPGRRRPSAHPGPQDQRSAPRLWLPQKSQQPRTGRRALRDTCDPLSAPSEAGVLVLGRSFGLVLALVGPSPCKDAVRSRLEVDVNVVEVTHNVRILAEGGHYLLLRRVDDLPAVHHDLHEIIAGHRLERIDQGRGIGAALAIGSVARMAFGMIAAEAAERVPVEGSIGTNLIGRSAIGVDVSAVLVLYRRLGLPVIWLRRRCRGSGLRWRPWRTKPQHRSNCCYREKRRLEVNKRHST